jgi:hypothetical protein
VHVGTSPSWLLLVQVDDEHATQYALCPSFKVFRKWTKGCFNNMEIWYSICHAWKDYVCLTFGAKEFSKINWSSVRLKTYLVDGGTYDCVRQGKSPDL